MRLLTLMVLVACGPEYGVSSLCVSEGDLAACAVSETWDEAAKTCAFVGGDIATASTLAEQQELSAFGEREFDSVWWSGHAGYTYDCTVMSGGFGASAPWDCDEELPVVCRLGGDQ